MSAPKKLLFGLIKAQHPDTNHNTVYNKLSVKQ